MPNYIKNRFTVYGDNNRTKELLALINGGKTDKGKEIYIDFDKIIPCPEEIKAVGEIDSNLIYHVKNKYDVKPHDMLLISALETCNRQNLRPVSPDEQEVFDKACKAYEATGFIYWYDWNVAMWGTKWNAFEQDKIGDRVYEFETAWSGAGKVIEALIVMFPDLNIELKWADEDTGSNVGILKSIDGKPYYWRPENQSLDAYELAFDLRPHYRNDYHIVDGKYEYLSDED